MEENKDPPATRQSEAAKRWGAAFIKADVQRKSEAASRKTAAAEPSKTPREEVMSLWKDLVQKQRVHEMIKCLHAGKKKMEVMYNFKPTDDYLEFTQFAADEQAKKAEHKKSLDASAHNSLADTGTGTGTAAGRKSESQQGAQKPRKDSGKDKDKDDDEIALSSSKTKLIHTHTTQGVRTRNAAELLYNKANITDQEFEDILELCEDKIEQKALREAFEDKKDRQKYLKDADEMRVMLYNFVNGKFFTYFMLVSIITSIVGVFMMTFEQIANHYGFPLLIMDSMIIGIFLLEAILKITIYKEDYFHQLWNVLDMLIVCMHFVEISVDFVTLAMALSNDINEQVWFKFLKSLRALRLLRVIKFMPNLQVIVTTVFQSMLSIGSIAVLMLLFMFVFAVMGRGLFYDIHPEKFGDLWLSFVFLFQMLTLDDWFTGISDVMMTQIQIPEDNFEKEKIDKVNYWLLFFYLFSYLVIEYFVFLNLFVAVLVDNFQLSLADAEIQKQKEALEELEAAKKFEEMRTKGIDPNIFEEEHQRQLSEIEQLGMYVEDYFPVDKDSKEADLLADFYKDMNSVDFERFLWRRRFTLFNMVADAALTARQTTLEADSTSDEDDEQGEDAPPNPEELRRKIRKSLIAGPHGSLAQPQPGKSILKRSN